MRVLVAPLLLLPDASASDLSTVHLPFSREKLFVYLAKVADIFHSTSFIEWPWMDNSSNLPFCFSEPSSASAERIFLSWTDHLLENNRRQC